MDRFYGRNIDEEVIRILLIALTAVLWRVLSALA